MSNASTARPPLSQRSIILRMLRTPLSDLLHGRITGPVSRLRLQTILEQSKLPAPLAILITNVVKRTRLWKSEKLDVAAELAAHFADGLAHGETAEQLAKAFGDPAQAAALIRKAKKRNRPRIWRIARRTLQTIAAFFAFVLLVYLAMMARFMMGSPSKPIDYRPQLNAAALAVKEEDRAWPIYRQAALALPELFPDANTDKFGTFNRTPMPGEPQWQPFANYLDEHRAVITAMRRAKDKPGLGFIAGYEFSADDKLLWPQQQFRQEDIDRMGLMGVLFPILQPMRHLARALTLDAQNAAYRNEGGIALADLQTQLALSMHVRESPLIICDLVSLAIFEQTLNTANLILAHWPSAFSDAQLQALAHAIAALTDDHLAIRFSGERLGFEDTIQRLYTNDGNGDGRLTPEGVHLLEFFTAWDPNGQSPASSNYVMFAGPAINAVALGRRELLYEYHQMMDTAEAESRIPLWQRTDSAFETKLMAWASSPLHTARRRPLVLLMPALNKASLSAQYAIAARDATTTAIALELYRRRQGEYPATLDELLPIIPAVPPDRFDGTPLKYRLVDGRPVLYSVGVDRDDDGGVPPTMNGKPHNESARQWKSPERIAAIKAMQRPINVPPDVVLLADGDWILFPPIHVPLESSVNQFDP